MSVEGFVILGWDLILSGRRCLYETQVRIFHTVLSVIDPGDHRFRPRFVRVVDVWKYARTGNGALSFLGGWVTLVHAGSMPRIIPCPH